MSKDSQHCYKTTYDKADCAIGVVHIGYGAFHRAHQAIFPDGCDDGYYHATLNQGLSQPPVFISRDVVCIRCAPNDSSGRHNMIKDLNVTSRDEPQGWRMPPFAVTQRELPSTPPFRVAQLT